MDWKQKRRDDEPGIGDERKDRMPEPVFQHWFIIRLTACPPEHDDHIGRPPKTSSAAPKCTTLGVLKTAIPLLGDDARTRTPAIKVITTNSKPVSVAAAVPMML